MNSFNKIFIKTTIIIVNIETLFKKRGLFEIVFNDSNLYNISWTYIQFTNGLNNILKILLEKLMSTAQ